MQLVRDRRTNKVYAVGLDDTAILGEDMLLGADMFLGGDGNGATAEQVALARSTGGFVAANKKPAPVAFYQMLPFSVDVPALTTVQVALQPQRTFRVDNLIITSPEGPFFELDSWNVGQENMFVAQGSVNCAAFSEAAAQKGLGLRGFTANQGALVNLQFTNTDTNAHRLSGLLSGPALIRVG